MTALTWLKNSWRSSERFRFLVVGVYNTVFGYATFVCLYAIFSSKVHYLVLVAAAHFIAVANAFISHRRHTFEARGAMLCQFLRFNVSYLGVLALGLVSMPLAVNRAGLHPLVASALITAASVVSSYLLHKHYSFRHVGSSDR